MRKDTKPAVSRHNRIRLSTGRKVFLVLDYLFLTLSALMCLLPLINVLAVSLSSSNAAAAGYVKLLPVEFTLSSYRYALTKPQFLTAFGISARRVALGYVITMAAIILTAYPLSKEKQSFHARGMYAWVFIVTMMFSGGLIPTYMTIRYLGLLDSIWALVLPGAVPIFNVVLMMNFFRTIPHEIEEAAFIDGAGHVKTLLQIYLPLSLPSLATVSLFVIVNHWNSWFDGIIYMNHTYNYPLQSYLRTIIINPDLQSMTSSEQLVMKEISERTFKAAQIFLGALPILCVYPFLQRYFMSGLTMGSVKG
ncbi:MAG: carbohydrate ABC transporter permease [Clostridia bacterium]|nr:carbohydrate ABC transporter permease [Clostridia bacterium]